MAYDNSQWRAQPGGPDAGAGAEPGPGSQRRIDALDVLEGVLTDGLSFSNITRIARASGSNFWVGAALGAGLVVLVNRPDVRAAFGSIFRQAKAPEPPPAQTPPSA